MAMSNPFDAKKLHDLRLLVGLDIEPVLSTQPSILNKVKGLYRKQSPLAPEESPLSDDLFAPPSLEKASGPIKTKKKPLIIKNGMKIDSKDLSLDECNAPTLWGGQR